MSTRNITLSLPEEVVRRAKVLAAERDTSVSALVGELLMQAAGSSTPFDLAWANELVRMEQGIGLRVGEVSWTRDELHER
jgi:hypothetical protein